MPATNSIVQKLIDFAEAHEPAGGYFGPETLADILHEDSTALASFQQLFHQVNAAQLNSLEEQPNYGWIIAGAADELDLLPDDPRLFKTEDQLANIPESEMLWELCSACIANDINSVENLSKRIDVNQLLHGETSPLCLAVGNNHIECVRVLLASGADPNLVQDWGNTSMHDCATTVSSKQIWKLLIEYGGDPKTLNDDGKSAIELMLERGRSDWLA